MSNLNNLCFDCMMSERHPLSCIPELNPTCHLNTAPFGSYQPAVRRSTGQTPVALDPPALDTATASYGSSAAIASAPKKRRIKSQAQEFEGDSFPGTSVPKTKRTGSQVQETIGDLSGATVPKPPKQRARGTQTAGTIAEDSRLSAEPESMDSIENSRDGQNAFGTFDCQDPSCPKKGIKGLSSRRVMRKHMTVVHKTTLPHLPRLPLETSMHRCPQPMCGRAYARADKLDNHLREDHNIEVPYRKRGPQPGSKYRPRKRLTQEAESFEPLASQSSTTTAAMTMPTSALFGSPDPNASYEAGEAAWNTQPVGPLPGGGESRGRRPQSESERSRSRQMTQRPSSAHSEISVSSGNSLAEGPSRANTGDSLGFAPSDTPVRNNANDRELLRSLTLHMHATSLESDQRGCENVRRAEYTAKVQSQSSKSHANVSTKNPQINLTRKKGPFK